VEIILLVAAMLVAALVEDVGAAAAAVEVTTPVEDEGAAAVAVAMEGVAGGAGATAIHTWVKLRPYQALLARFPTPSS
jgi:hypothetical protein